jgi:hypothetical protein
MTIDERTRWNLRFLYPGLRDYVLRIAEARLTENIDAGAGAAVRAAIYDCGDAFAESVRKFGGQSPSTQSAELVGDVALINWTITRWKH